MSRRRVTLRERRELGDWLVVWSVFLDGERDADVLLSRSSRGVYRVVWRDWSSTRHEREFRTLAEVREFLAGGL